MMVWCEVYVDKDSNELKTRKRRIYNITQDSLREFEEVEDDI